MALSGTYTLTRTALEIYTEVLEILQVIGDGETITTAMKAKITPTLNNMLKAWEARGMHLQTFTEGSLFLQVGQNEYDFTDSSTMLANTYFQTALSQDEIATATTITVDDVSNISNTDNIGIIDANNNLFWTTVNGAPSGDVVTLTDALPTAVTSGSVVFSYPAVTFIPVRKIKANGVRRKEPNDYEIPINFESRQDYFDLPNKNQRGLPIQAYYSRQEPQGIMYLWTTPDNAQSVINFSYERETQIITQDSDNFDLPSYYTEALVFNIADRIKLKFSTSPERSAEIKAEARRSLDEAENYDDAVYDITVSMDQHG